MKRLILAFFCALLICSLVPRVVSAQGPQGAGTDGKSHKIKAPRHWWWHRDKHKKEKTAPLYSVPKSVGWWHHRGPGPAGAGVKQSGGE
jgi:hypothetical protein